MQGENEVPKEKIFRDLPFLSLSAKRRARVANFLKLVLIPALLIVVMALPKQVDAASLRLTWTADFIDIDGFKIERSNGSTYAEIATAEATALSYTDSGLVSGTTYCYRVRSFNSTGYSDYSNLDCATAPSTLIITNTGTGSGTVTSSPPGTDCSTDCSVPYSSDTIVTLTATPAAGSIFAGWSGGTCTGTGVCAFVVYADTSVTATFNLDSVPGVASLISPSGTITTQTPTYAWDAAPGATWYFLWVADLYGRWIWQWYTAADVGCASDSSICSITPSTSLPLGEALWWVIGAWNDAGYGPWSSATSFTVVP